MSKLGVFMQQRMDELGISHRGLASRCDISHNVIDDLINDEVNISEMRLGTFQQLSSGLNVSIDVLIALAAPDAYRTVSPDTRLLQEEIEALPEAGRELMRLGMRALRLQMTQKPPDNPKSRRGKRVKIIKG